jgi:hypothetical protein
MKRALAQRAKESGHPNGLAPPVVVSSNNSGEHEPPTKLSRVEEEEVTPISVPSQPEKFPVPSPRGDLPKSSNSHKISMKRQRANAGSDEDEEEDKSAFYLKHQNSALASELKQLQYQFKLLEKERDSRRQQCDEANQALHALESTWTQMEVALQLGQQPPEDEVRAACASFEPFIFVTPAY